MDYPNLPEPYNSLTAEELPQAQAAIAQFLQSPAYKLFRTDYEQAIDMASDTIIRSAPSNISDIILREQAIGQLEQMKAVLDWFSAKNEDLTQILETKNKNNNE